MKPKFRTKIKLEIPLDKIGSPKEFASFDTDKLAPMKAEDIPAALWENYLISIGEYKDLTKKGSIYVNNRSPGWFSDLFEYIEYIGKTRESFIIKNAGYDVNGDPLFKIELLERDEESKAYGCRSIW